MRPDLPRKMFPAPSGTCVGGVDDLVPWQDDAAELAMEQGGRSCLYCTHRETADELSGSFRAHPGSLDSRRGICSKSPEHDADHGEADECSNGRCVAFEVANQTTVTTNPRERSFDDPPFRQHLKSSSVRSLDDLQVPGTSAPHRHRHLASRVCTVSKNAFDERE